MLPLASIKSWPAREDMGQSGRIVVVGSRNRLLARYGSMGTEAPQTRFDPMPVSMDWFGNALAAAILELFVLHEVRGPI